MKKELILFNILFVLILLSGCINLSKKPNGFEVVSIKTESGTQTILVGTTVNISFNTLPGQTVNLDDVSITAKEGLTKIEGLTLPLGVTKTAQVLMPSGSVQVCVDDSESAALSAACTDADEVIILCPGSAGGFTCSIITDTLFEVSGLTHSTIGSVESCSGHGRRVVEGGIPGDPASTGLPIEGSCICDAGYSGTICEIEEKPCTTKCESINGVAACVDGKCKITSCNPGFADCKNGYPDGCETNIRTDGTNCGSCFARCSFSAPCVSGVCNTIKPLTIGQTCISHLQCESRNCLDAQSGKRCASVTSCGTCNVINNVGTACVNVTSGTDPKDECLSDSTSTCGNNGNCDGAGACQKYSLGTPCGADSICLNFVYMPIPTCDGAGTCVSITTNCDDEDVCTDDSCYDVSGCYHTSISCNDNNYCTDDSCSGGCIHIPANDGEPCGEGGNCENGICFS